MPPDPRAFNPALPVGVAQVILRALAKEPRQRWTDVLSLVRARVHSLGHTVQRYLELYRSLNPAARPVGVPLWPIAAG